MVEVDFHAEKDDVFLANRDRAAHAPHSLSPDLLRRLAGEGGPAAIHLAESPEEVQFLADGGGPWGRLPGTDRGCESPDAALGKYWPNPC